MDELRRKGASYIEMFKGLSQNVAAELEDVQLTDPDITYADGHSEIECDQINAPVSAIFVLADTELSAT